MVLRTEASLTIIYDGRSIARLIVAADMRAGKGSHWKEKKERKERKFGKMSVVRVHSPVSNLQKIHINFFRFGPFAKESTSW
jgi:hypothetical protein